ncbi:uncharacterized protein LOC135924496 [Gordionus sp. m RMFG-2023]|uniref:uncharacterized protein LOC135924496 n=1 Tax=Gordionus sp. m RMFG-2023 TaxID=3053472 RepID=UPI0031FCEDD9
MKNNAFKWEKFPGSIVKYTNRRNVDNFKWEKYPRDIIKIYSYISKKPRNSELNLGGNLRGNFNSNEMHISEGIYSDQPLKTCEILRTDGINRLGQCPRVNLRIDCRHTDMLFDTGASISIMSCEYVYKYWPNGVIIKENMCLKQFDGSEIEVFGKTQWYVVFNDTIISLDLWIVGKAVETIMGWDWITTIGPYNNYWNLFIIDSELAGDNVKRKLMADNIRNELQKEGISKLLNDENRIVVNNNFIETPEKVVISSDHTEINGKIDRDQFMEIEIDGLKKIDLAIPILVRKYGIIFEEKLGRLNDYQVDVKLKKGFSPNFLACRRVPFEWKREIDEELDQWVRNGIIIPVEYSEWATPLVPVRKSNGKLRLCADFRVTLNRWVVEVKYPLPRIKEILASLKGIKYFSKVDFSSSYLQLPLKEEIHKLFTITTPK